MTPEKLPTFTEAREVIKYLFYKHGRDVHTETWQGVDISKRPEAKMKELLGITFTVPLLGVELLDHWRSDIKPNLPWADDHFDERVCGHPINPGKEWANWPWGSSAENFLHMGQFNQNYMERYWAKYANKGVYQKPLETYADSLGDEPWYDSTEPHRGIRHEYGDLNDLVDLLVEQPDTRQAWLPIFFPEDTGIGDGGRKPCSLGYHFLMRDNKLNVYYPLRSCDFAMHWADDCYLTVRLLLWVLDECRKRSDRWLEVRPGEYSMYCGSLHVFTNEYRKMMGGR